MTVSQLIGKFVVVILNPTIELLFGIALLVFLWGIAKFIWSDAENEGNREEGRQHMIWGIVGMFIMISALGIISIVTNTLGIDNPSPGTTQVAPSGGSGATLPNTSQVYTGGTVTPSGGAVNGYPLGNSQDLTQGVNAVTGGGNTNTPLLNRFGDWLFGSSN